MSTGFPTRRIAKLSGHNGQIPALTYSAGLSQYILTACTDRLIRLYNHTTGKLIQTYSAHGYEVLDIAVKDDNSQFVSGGGDKSVFLWDVARGVTVRRWGGNGGHVGRVEGVAWGKVGEVVVSGSYDSTLKIWDPRSTTPKPILTLSDARDSVTTVRIHGHSIISGSNDGKIRTYDIRMGQLTTDVMGSPITSLSPSKDEQSLLVSSLRETMLLDRSTGKRLVGFEAQAWRRGEYRLRSALGFNERYAVCGGEDGWVHVWDTSSGREIWRGRHSEEVKEPTKGEGKAKKEVVSAVAVCGARRQWASAGSDGNVVIWGDEAA